MPDRCLQELCTRWSGEGSVCPCALFGLTPQRDWDDTFDDDEHDEARS